VYRGNIDSFVSQKQERLAVLKSQYEGQQAKIAEIERFVARFGAKATKARQAQSRLKQLEKMDLIEMPEDRSSIRFRFPPAPHSGKEVVTIKNAGLRFGEKNIFKDLNWVIQRGSRVAIVGVNGAGKTSFLRLLSQELMPTQGEVKFGHAVEVGYYAQIQAESLNMNQTILQELEAVAPDLPVSRVRGIAGAFLFSGDAVEKKCAVLSGGEKARVALAKLLLSPSNFLILDEPTNHLDVNSRGVLLEALEDYEGTLCIVSHDREFMKPLVDTVLEIIPQSESNQGSQVIALVGSYEDYLERKIKEASARLSDSSSSKKLQKDTAPADQSVMKKGPSNNQIRSWERERDSLEGEISRLEARQVELHQLLANEKTYQDKEFSLKLMEEQRVLTQTLNDKMSRWETLCEMLL
ncbi:ABC transporter ATP-binding protein, partial [bacterium]|nr:ABC transporter ATP-binding protein [bacterium]